MTIQHRAGKFSLRKEPCLRRKYICMFFLATLCLMMWFAARPYSSPAPVLLVIGRSIQSWTEAEGSNFTADAEMVYNFQREQIETEMKTYAVKGWKKKYVPEAGGRPLISLLVTTWRSGSTFLGEVLNSIPGMYYHYEPLLYYGVVKIRGPPEAESAIETLTNLLNCTYANEEYLDYGQAHNWLFTHNWRLWQHCTTHPHLCWSPKFLNKFCTLFPFQLMKVIRMRLELLESLIELPNFNVKMVLLVRDPRGTLQSRDHRRWCPSSPDCAEPERLCSDLLADHKAALRLMKNYPQSFKAVRYEDIAINPYNETSKILRFLGFNFHESVKKFLDTHTKTNAGGVSSTYRDSKKAPFHWRNELPYSRVLNIQKHCKEAMKVWGYVPATSATHQRSFNPVKPTFKMH